MPISARERAVFGGLCLCFALLACLHNLRLPLWEGPDEGDNLMYVRYLATERHLPQPTTKPSFELEHLGRGHMPPLWFLSQVPLFLAVHADRWQATPTLNPDFLRRLDAGPNKPQSLDEALARPFGRLFHRHGRDEQLALAGANFDLRLLRLTSVFWAVIALWATWRAARVLLPDHPSAALAAAALLAFTPQFQHLSGTLTMDLMLAACGTLALWQALEWTAGSRSAARAALLAGAFAGLACLVKINGLVLLPALALAGLLARSRARGSARAWIACALGFALIAGPYYAWGWIESGHPLWSWKYQQVSPFHNAEAGALQPAGLERWKWFWTVLFLSWFADFGWTSVWFPAWVNLLAAALLLSGFLAFLPKIWRHAGGCCGRLTVRQLRLGGGLLAASALLIVTAEVYFNLRFVQPQARHLYPFLPALIVPVALGLARLRLLWLAVGFHALCSLLAIPVLLERLRPEGWNSDPRWSATDEGRAAQPVRDIRSGPAVEWLPRESQQELTVAEHAPRLAWEARAGALYDLALAVDNPSFRDQPWRLHGHVFRAIADLGLAPEGSLPLPESFWRELPPQTRVHVQAIELGADGGAVARSPLRELKKR